MKLKIIPFDQKGAAAIEFAIILPLLLMLLFGMIEFGIILYDKAMITNASREGARAGIVFVSGETLEEFNKKISDAVDKYCNGHLITFGEGSTTPNIKAQTTKPVQGTNLTVIVSYRYDYLVLPNFVDDYIILSAQTTMRME